MGAGHSIAVQNFSENIGILTMVGVYALMVRMHVSIDSAIMLFGTFVTCTMLLVIWRHRMNQAEFDSLHLVGADRGGAAEGSTR
jgi:membrane-bound ClpP family serine protease